MVKSLTTSPKNIFRTITGSSSSNNKSNTIETHVTTHYNHYSRSVDSNQYFQPVNRPEVRTLKQSDFTPMMTRPQEASSTTASATVVTITAASTMSSSTSNGITMNSKYISTTLPSGGDAMLSSYCSTTTTATTASSSSSEMLDQRCTSTSRYEYNNDSNHCQNYRNNQLNGNGMDATMTPYLQHKQHGHLANDMPKYENTYQYAATTMTTSSSSSSSAIAMHSGPHNDALTMNGKYTIGKSNGMEYDGDAMPEGRYGKILAPNHHPHPNSMVAGHQHQQIANNNQHDRYNANGQYQQQSLSPVPTAMTRHNRIIIDNNSVNNINNNINNNNNNNNKHTTTAIAVAATAMHSSRTNNDYGNRCMSPKPMKSATINNSIMGKSSGNVSPMLVRPTPPLPPSSSAVHSNNSKDVVTNGNGLLRVAAHQSHRTTSGNHNHPLAHLIGSLSSPESAYSTGYSTDGTSPGELKLFLFFHHYIIYQFSHDRPNWKIAFWHE